MPRKNAKLDRCSNQGGGINWIVLSIVSMDRILTPLGQGQEKMRVKG